MKTKLILSSVIITVVSAVATFFIVSCQKNVQEETPSVDIYDQIGQLHNEGLAYIFNQIKKQPKTKSGAREISTQFVINECNIFLERKGYNSDIELSSIPFNANLQCPNTTKFNSNEVLKIGSYVLSDKESYYYNSLKAIGHNNPDNLEIIKYEIDKLKQELMNDGSVSDKEPLLYCIAVFKSSIEYWSENLEKWFVEVLGVDEAMTKIITTKNGGGCTCHNNKQPEELGFWESLWDATWKTAVTDAGGALVGAAAGLAGGPLAPVTSSAGAVTVGLGSSATYCLGQVID